MRMLGFAAYAADPALIRNFDRALVARLRAKPVSPRQIFTFGGYRALAHERAHPPSSLPHRPAAASLGARVRSALAWRWGTQVLAQLSPGPRRSRSCACSSRRDYGLYAMTQVVLTALAFLNGQASPPR